MLHHKTVVGLREVGLGSVGGLGPWSGRVSHPLPVPTHPEWPRTVTHQPPSIATERLQQMRALRAMAALLVGVVALVSLLVGSAATASASSCSGSLADGEIRVVLVVDSSDLGGGASATCLVVPAGTTGSQLLARRGSELGTGSPRYGSSGLLCAIDGLPATGCGDRSSGGFEYWAYFNGSSGSWVYGNINPFTRRLSDGDIEGWRYVQGAGNGQDPPPRIGPSRSLFPALAPVLPELPPVSASSSVTAAPSGASAAGITASTAPAGADVAIDPILGATSGGSVSTTSAVDPVVVGDVALASSTSSHSSTGRWIGIAAVFGLIAVMAGGAWVQTRRSR